MKIPITLANGFIEAFKNKTYKEMSIEEWSLNPYSLEIRKGYKPFFVRMAKDGEVLEILESDSTYGFRDTNDNYCFDIHNNIYTHVWAKDEKHAIKITNEKRTMAIANNQWGLKD